MNFKMKVVSNVQVTVAYVVQYLYTYEYMQSCLSFLTSRRLKSNPVVSKSCTCTGMGIHWHLESHIPQPHLQVSTVNIHRKYRE